MTSKVETITSGTTGRGYPIVKFVEDIPLFLNEFSFTTESAIEEMNTLYQYLKKCKFMEVQLSKQKSGLKSKVPEIKKTLEMVEMIASKKESEQLSTKFSLSDNLYATADIECNGTVCLWLGADVMAEYPYQEAIDLLSSNFATATRRLKEVSEDLAFLRNQIITLEVNIARIYNHDVKQRRLAKIEEAKENK